MMKRRSKVIRRDICCKRQQPLPEIPYELVIEILRRLPGKSLMRFKSVSKHWSSLICSKDFTDSFLKVSSSPPRVYMWLWSWLGLYKSNIQDADAVLLSSSCPDSEITSMSSFVLDQDLTIPGIKGYLFSHVFQGLMCFSNGPSALIYNTTTRQLVVLPRIEKSEILTEDHKCKQTMYTIGYDPVHHRYKVVCTVTYEDEDGDYTSEHWILVLGGDVTSGWRKIPCCGSQAHCPLGEGLSTIIDGRMHYLTSVDFSYYALVSIDISSEEISMLQVPDNYWYPNYKYNSLIEYGGRVAILDATHFTKEGVLMTLIIMEDEEKNRWSTKNLVLPPCQMHMLINEEWRVQGTTINDEVILVPENPACVPGTSKTSFKPQATNIFHALLYNLQKNHLRKVDIKEPSSRYLDRVWNVIGFDDVENLVCL